MSTQRPMRNSTWYRNELEWTKELLSRGFSLKQDLHPKKQRMYNFCMHYLAHAIKQDDGAGWTKYAGYLFDNILRDGTQPHLQGRMLRECVHHMAAERGLGLFRSALEAGGGEGEDVKLVLRRTIEEQITEAVRAYTVQLERDLHVAEAREASVVESPVTTAAETSGSMAHTDTSTEETVVWSELPDLFPSTHDMFRLTYQPRTVGPDGSTGLEPSDNGCECQ